MTTLINLADSLISLSAFESSTEMIPALNVREIITKVKAIDRYLAEVKEYHVSVALNIISILKWDSVPNSNKGAHKVLAKLAKGLGVTVQKLIEKGFLGRFEKKTKPIDQTTKFWLDKAVASDEEIAAKKKADEDAKVSVWDYASQIIDGIQYLITSDNFKEDVGSLTDTAALMMIELNAYTRVEILRLLAAKLIQIYDDCRLSQETRETFRPLFQFRDSRQNMSIEDVTAIFKTWLENAATLKSETDKHGCRYVKSFIAVYVPGLGAYGAPMSPPTDATVNLKYTLASEKQAPTPLFSFDGTKPTLNAIMSAYKTIHQTLNDVFSGGIADLKKVNELFCDKMESFYDYHVNVVSIGYAIRAMLEQDISNSDIPKIKTMIETLLEGVELLRKKNYFHPVKVITIPAGPSKIDGRNSEYLKSVENNIEIVKDIVKSFKDLKVEETQGLHEVIEVILTRVYNVAVAISTKVPEDLLTMNNPNNPKEKVAVDSKFVRDITKSVIELISGVSKAVAATAKWIDADVNELLRQIEILKTVYVARINQGLIIGVPEKLQISLIYVIKDSPDTAPVWDVAPAEKEKESAGAITRSMAAAAAAAVTAVPIPGAAAVVEDDGEPVLQRVEYSKQKTSRKTPVKRKSSSKRKTSSRKKTVKRKSSTKPKRKTSSRKSSSKRKTSSRKSSTKKRKNSRK